MTTETHDNPEGNNAKTFVLVHGAWVGQWCYDPIIPLLQSRGHQAHAVSLTGFGRLSHLNTPHLTIQDHIRDVVNLVLSKQLQSIALVGHSYGGAVITGAWDVLRDRVSAVFFLDAATPSDGQSHLDSMRSYDAGAADAVVNSVLEEGGMRPFPIEQLRQRNPTKAAYMQSRVMLFPMRCSTSPINFTRGPLPQDVPRHYVLCLRNKSYHHRQAVHIRNDRRWHYYEIDTFHDCMAENPNGVVDILLGVTAPLKSATAKSIGEGDTQ